MLQSNEGGLIFLSIMPVFESMISGTSDRPYSQEIDGLRAFAILPMLSRSVSRDLVHGRLSDLVALAARLSVPLQQAWARSERGQAAGAPAVATAANFEQLPSRFHFCGLESCSVMVTGQAGYYDNNHITNSSSRNILGTFVPISAGLTP
jgi:hypothetical protein